MGLAPIAIAPASAGTSSTATSSALTTSARTSSVPLWAVWESLGLGLGAILDVMPIFATAPADETTCLKGGVVTGIVGARPLVLAVDIRHRQIVVLLGGNLLDQLVLSTPILAIQIGRSTLILPILVQRIERTRKLGLAASGREILQDTLDDVVGNVPAFHVRWLVCLDDLLDDLDLLFVVGSNILGDELEHHHRALLCDRQLPHIATDLLQ